MSPSFEEYFLVHIILDILYDTNQREQDLLILSLSKTFSVISNGGFTSFGRLLERFTKRIYENNVLHQKFSQPYSIQKRKIERADSPIGRMVKLGPYFFRSTLKTLNIIICRINC